MEDGTCYELGVEFIAQPEKVPGVAGVGRVRGLDLDIPYTDPLTALGL